MNHRPLPLTTWVFIMWLMWGPVIINSQPGTQFYMLGIDWKADNLDNTMFWSSWVLLILGAITETYKEKQEKEYRLKIGQKDQERDLR